MLTDLGFSVFIPPLRQHTGIGAYVSMLLDAADEKAAMILRVPKTGNIRKVGWRTGTVTTGATLDVRLETVGVDGNPSGTLWGTNTNASRVLVGTDDDTFFSDTLTADAAVTVGDLIAVVIVNPSGSPGNFNVVGSQSGDSGGVGGQTVRTNPPYTDLYTTSWAKNVTRPCVYLEYDDGSIPQMMGCYPVSTNNVSDTLSSSTTPDEIGNVITLPMPMGASGIWASADLDFDGDFVLYDADGTTALQTVSADKDFRAGTSSAVGMYMFNAVQPLKANTQYRIVLKPTTTSSVTLAKHAVPSAAVMAALELGTAVHKTSRVDAGSWSQDASTRMMIGLMVSAFATGRRLGFQLGI